MSHPETPHPVAPAASVDHPASANSETAPAATQGVASGSAAAVHPVDADALVATALTEAPSFASRVACMIFAVSLALVVLVVGAFLVSERSALRRTDADTFGALADHAARSLTSRANGADASTVGDEIHMELSRLAEVRGVRRVSLLSIGSGEFWSARPETDPAPHAGTLTPRPIVLGPGRTLGQDQLTVSRDVRLVPGAGEEAVLVIEAAYPGLERRMRDLVSLSGRVIGIATLFLVFMVPLLARFLVRPMARAARTVRSGHVPEGRYVTAGGQELVDLVHRMEQDEHRAVGFLEAHERAAAGAFAAVEKMRRERDGALDALEQSRTQERSAKSAKAAFVANTSHEIRTPLHAVLGTNQLLLETELDDEQRALCERNIRASRALLFLVDDVLDLARFDAREISIESKPFDPAKLVEEVAELVAPSAGAKGLKVSCDFAAGVPEKVMGDAGRIRQALLRLGDNAVKFTEIGEISMGLAVEPGPNGMPCTVFSVRDTGVGIAEDRRARLFDAFELMDHSNTRRYAGAGLGLALVARIARASAGEVEVQSREGEGTCMRLVLPLPEVTPSTGAAGDGASTVSQTDVRPLEGLTVLLVDDAPIGAPIATRVLEELGATVHTESSTYAGFEALLRSEYDVALVDETLPGRDPFLAALASSEDGRAVPVVLLSSNFKPRGASDLHERSASAILLRPVTRESVMRTVSRALGRIAPKAKRKGKLDTGLLDPAQRSATRLLLVDDNATNLQLVQYVLTKRGYTVDVATNGQKAVEAFEAGHYHAVLMDCQMPIMDGYTATRTIRHFEHAHGRFPIPVLATTAGGVKDARERCEEAGMDDMIQKPYQPHSMLEWLERWLLRSQAARKNAGVEDEEPGPVSGQNSESSSGSNSGSDSEPSSDPDRQAEGQPTPSALQQAFDDLVPLEVPGALSAKRVAQDLEDALAGGGAAPSGNSGTKPEFDPMPEPPAPLPSRGGRPEAQRAKAIEDAVDRALDTRILMDLCDDEVGRELAGDLLNGYLETSEDTVIALEAAAREGDLKECGRIAHGLVSSCGMVGALGLAELLRSLELVASRGEAEPTELKVRDVRVEYDRTFLLLEKTAAELAAMGD